MITVETYPSLREAAQASRGASFLGGGTLLMRAVNYAEEGLERLVRTTDPTLKEIRRDGSRIVIGAGVTMADVIRSQELEFLSSAARAVGGPAIRSAATVGGNLFANHPYGDFAVALLALDTFVVTVENQEIPLEQFLSGRDTFNGLVQSVLVAPAERGSLKFLKVSRVKPKGVSMMSIAVRLPPIGGRVQNARIAFGAMGPTPLRAKAAEAALEGQSLSDNTIEAAARVITQDLQPQDDPIASSWYRREVAAVHFKRLIQTGGY